MLVQLNVLQMVLVLLFRRESQFSALVQGLSIALAGYSHHHVLLVRSQNGLVLHDTVVFSSGPVLTVGRGDTLATDSQSLHIAALSLGTGVQVTIRHLVAYVRACQLANRAEARGDAAQATSLCIRLGVNIWRHSKRLLLRLVIQRRLQPCPITRLAHLRVINLPARSRLRLRRLGRHSLLTDGGSWRGRDNGSTVHPVERYK